MDRFISKGHKDISGGSIFDGSGLRHLWDRARASLTSNAKDSKKTFTLEVCSEEVKVLYTRILALQSLVDERLDPREIEYLYVFMSQIGLSSDSREEVRQALGTRDVSLADVVRLVEEVISAVPDNQEEIAVSIIKDMVHLSRADNVVLPQEQASIEVTSELRQEDILFYYYVDYEEFDELDDGLGRFHAQWRRQNPSDGVEEVGQSNEEFLFGGENIGGGDNYTILEAEGRGRYVGCVLSVHNLRETNQWNWYGEGDDMIFIDGEEWPPSLHGTGTEDYFNTAWCPQQEYSAPYHGITLGGGDNWSGQISLYRFHIEDPISFERSIQVTIEHGHANKRSDDYSSVAYWYQTEPHKPFSISPVEERSPRPQ